MATWRVFRRARLENAVRPMSIPPVMAVGGCRRQEIARKSPFTSRCDARARRRGWTGRPRVPRRSIAWRLANLKHTCVDLGRKGSGNAPEAMLDELRDDLRSRCDSCSRAGLHDRSGGDAGAASAPTAPSSRWSRDAPPSLPFRSPDRLVMCGAHRPVGARRCLAAQRGRLDRAGRSSSNGRGLSDRRRHGR